MDYTQAIELRAQSIIGITEKYLTGRIPFVQAKTDLADEMRNIRPAQFERVMISLINRVNQNENETVIEKINDLFSCYLPYPYKKLDEGHPIKNCYEENFSLKKLLIEIDKMDGKDSRISDWVKIYRKLEEYLKHIDREQQNLYPVLARKDMKNEIDTAIEMGISIKKDILYNISLLKNRQSFDFLYSQRMLTIKLTKFIEFEEKLIYANSLKRISVKEFCEIKSIDDIFGYSYIGNPPKFNSSKLEILESLEQIFQSLLEINAISMVFYSTSGELLTSYGRLIRSYEYNRFEDIFLKAKENPNIITTIIDEDNKGKVIIKTKKMQSTDTSSQGILITAQMIHTNDASITYDSENIQGDVISYTKEELIMKIFIEHPRFMEDFFDLHVDLVGLKGVIGMQLLKDATIEMVAISIRENPEDLTVRINEVIGSYKHKI